MTDNTTAPADTTVHAEHGAQPVQDEATHATDVAAGADVAPDEAMSEPAAAEPAAVDAEGTAEQIYDAEPETPDEPGGFAALGLYFLVVSQ